MSINNIRGRLSFAFVLSVTSLASTAQIPEREGKETFVGEIGVDSDGVAKVGTGLRSPAATELKKVVPRPTDRTRDVDGYIFDIEIER